MPTLDACSKLQSIRDDLIVLVDLFSKSAEAEVSQKSMTIQTIPYSPNTSAEFGLMGKDAKAPML
ncbi:hypothetical protein [Pseudomonas sp. AM8]|uniref:hypothetical protein n=1 Tax=Pseudomonas sp. AM8 TaxID=2983368 RepID=UPI002E8090FF|nr:hypothetical protein [Pseudomonas sp. AM8]